MIWLRTPATEGDVNGKTTCWLPKAQDDTACKTAGEVAGKPLCPHYRRSIGLESQQVCSVEPALGQPGRRQSNLSDHCLVASSHRSLHGTGTISNFEHFEHDLQKAAHDYLVAANTNPRIDPPLGLPHEWLDALDPDQPGVETPCSDGCRLSSLEQNNR